MQLEGALPYRKWLPKRLKERGWSYRQLERYIKKPASYLNATVKGARNIPKPKIIEDMASLFNVSPYTVIEYKQAKAIEKILAKPELIDPILMEDFNKKESQIIKIDGQPLTKEEKYEYRLAGEEAVRRFRRARGQPGAGESQSKRKGTQGKSATS